MSRHDTRRERKGRLRAGVGGAFPPPGDHGRNGSGRRWWVLLAGPAFLVLAGLLLWGQLGVVDPGRSPTVPPVTATVGEVRLDVASARTATVGVDARPQTPSWPPHDLDVVELVTGDGDPTAALPVIIAVHGLGDRPEAFVRLFQGIQVPVRIIAPRGPQSYHQGYSWFSTTIQGGRVVHWDASDMADSAQRLAWLAQELADRWPTAGKPVMTGFSQGGILAFVVAANHPDVISEAIPVSGLWPLELRHAGQKQTVRLPRVVALHGEEDQLVNYDLAVESVAALQELGYPASMESFPGVGHGIAPSMRVRLMTYLTGGP
jgi:phospholipase/carboxylesterase